MTGLVAWTVPRLATLDFDLKSKCRDYKLMIRLQISGPIDTSVQDTRSEAATDKSINSTCAPFVNDRHCDTMLANVRAYVETMC